MRVGEWVSSPSRHNKVNGHQVTSPTYFATHNSKPLSTERATENTPIEHLGPSMSLESFDSAPHELQRSGGCLCPSLH